MRLEQIRGGEYKILCESSGAVNNNDSRESLVSINPIY